jgi:hypothetical protein
MYDHHNFVYFYMNPNFLSHIPYVAGHNFHVSSKSNHNLFIKCCK